MSAAKRVGEACNAKQANELAVQANERVDERMAQHSICDLMPFLILPRVQCSGGKLVVVVAVVMVAAHSGLNCMRLT